MRHEFEMVTSRQQVAAVVNSGTYSSRAGLQIRVDGMVRTGHIFAFANKKKPLRFCVGDPDSHSSAWSVFANRTSSDVYIVLRTSASLHKISLHESGDFRHQLIGMDARTLNLPELSVHSPEAQEGRILHRWVREKGSKSGWTDCMRILVPASELRPGDAKLDGVTWVPAPPTGYATEIRFFMVAPGRGEFDLTEGLSKEGALSVIGGFKLVNGEVLVVISATIPVSDNDQRMIRKVKRAGPSIAHANFDWSQERRPRTLITTGIETPTFWDLDA